MADQQQLEAINDQLARLQDFIVSRRFAIENTYCEDCRSRYQRDIQRACDEQTTLRLWRLIDRPVRLKPGTTDQEPFDTAVGILREVGDGSALVDYGTAGKFVWSAEAIVSANGGANADG